MTRIRHSLHYGSSIGIRTPFGAQKVAQKKDNRPNISRIGGGNPIMIICPNCNGTVRSRKARKDDCGPGIKKGDLLIGAHRIGGGTYSIRRGDVFCLGVGLPVPIKED